MNIVYVKRFADSRLRGNDKKSAGMTHFLYLITHFERVAIKVDIWGELILWMVLMI